MRKLNFKIQALTPLQPKFVEFEFFSPKGRISLIECSWLLFILKIYLHSKLCFEDYCYELLYHIARMEVGEYVKNIWFTLNIKLIMQLWARFFVKNL